MNRLLDAVEPDFRLIANVDVIMDSLFDALQHLRLVDSEFH